MYFDCPVLISNHPGYNLQFRKAALYFSPLDERDIVDKIEELNDYAVLDDLIAKGKELIKENTCAKYIDSFLNIVDNFYLTRQCWTIKENYRVK